MTSVENIEFIREWIRRGRVAHVMSRHGRLPRSWIVSYVLWVIGELPDGLATRLNALAGRAGYDRSPFGSWQAYVERTLRITDADRAALQSMWERSRAATSAHNINLPAEAWATAVVNSNLIDEPTTHGVEH